MKGFFLGRRGTIGRVSIGRGSFARRSGLVGVLFVLIRTITFAQVDENVVFTSSNLPIVIINTNGQAIVDDPKITADMGIIDNGVSRNNVTDPYNAFSGKIGIEIRGSSSQMFPKKQWGIELRDDVGQGKEASLLGCPRKRTGFSLPPTTIKL